MALTSVLALAGRQVGYGPTSALDGHISYGSLLQDASTCTQLTHAHSIQLRADQANTSFLCKNQSSSSGPSNICLPPAASWIGKTFRFELQAPLAHNIVIISDPDGEADTSGMTGLLLNNNTPAPVTYASNVFFYSAFAGTGDCIVITSVSSTNLVVYAISATGGISAT